MKNNQFVMMNVKRYIFGELLLLLAVLLVVTGCRNIFEAPKPEKLMHDIGHFLLMINGFDPQRTIMPSDADISSNVALYILEFSENNTNADLVVIERNSVDLFDPIELKVGTWNLSVTAYLDEERTRFSQGTLTGIIINTGETVTRTVTFTLPAITGGGTGTFSWNINYPENVIRANMTITPFDETDGTLSRILYFVGGTPLTNKESSLTLDTGYYHVVFKLLSEQRNTERSDILHIYQDMVSNFTFTFPESHFSDTTIFVTNNADDGTGSLRQAIADASNEGSNTIIINNDVGTIKLKSRLNVNKNITLEGNGVTVTRDSTWATINTTSQLMYTYNNSTVTISRIWFKDGMAADNGAAIYSYDGNLTLESCIFSGNRTSPTTIIAKGGGAIYNRSSGITYIKGCTFYNNSTTRNGGAIYNDTGPIILDGNLFCGNTANYFPVVYSSAQSGVVSKGHNVVDVSLNNAGWTIKPGDKTVSSLPVSFMSLKLLPESEAANVITTLPAKYPTVDFYGNPTNAPAAAGAVQAVVDNKNGYLLLDLTVNRNTSGNVSFTPEPDADGIVSGAITFTATPAEGYSLMYWLVNETMTGNENPLIFTLSDHTRVHAVFGRIFTVDNFTDTSDSTTTPGTLRHALTNVDDDDVISLSGVTPGETVIALIGRLPDITKNITIEGNGITLTRADTWYETNRDSQLMYIGRGVTVMISRIHFKNGRATTEGAAVNNNGGNLSLESCIFSGNRTSATYASGGAICSYGTLSVKGCTFYTNSSSNYGSGGVIYTRDSTNPTLLGNLFYGNTASSSPVAGGNTTSNGYANSNGYNIVDVALGTSSQGSGWFAGTGDATFANLGISGDPFDTSTFVPVPGLGSVIPSAPADFPTTDFYGNIRTFPGTPGAVAIVK
jgi:hypothetical protein